jgi:hypothetical protein
MNPALGLVALGTALAIGKLRSGDGGLAEFGSVDDDHILAAKQLIVEMEQPIDLLKRMDIPDDAGFFRCQDLEQVRAQITSRQSKVLAHVEAVTPGHPDLPEIEKAMNEVGGDSINTILRTVERCRPQPNRMLKEAGRMNDLALEFIDVARNEKTSCKTRFLALEKATGFVGTMDGLTQDDSGGWGFTEEFKDLRKASEELDDVLEVVSKEIQDTCLVGQARPAISPPRVPVVVSPLTKEEQQRAKILVSIDPSISPAQAEALVLRNRKKIR